MGLFSYSSIRMYYQVFMVFMMFMVLLPQLIINLQLIETSGFNRNHWISCAVFIYLYIIFHWQIFSRNGAFQPLITFLWCISAASGGMRKTIPNKKISQKTLRPSPSKIQTSLGLIQSLDAEARLLQHTSTILQLYNQDGEGTPHPDPPCRCCGESSTILTQPLGDSSWHHSGARRRSAVPLCSGRPWRVSSMVHGLRSVYGNIYGWTEFRAPKFMKFWGISCRCSLHPSSKSWNHHLVMS